MTDGRKAGIILIVGSVGGILTMAIHPGQPWLPSGQMTNLVALSGAAHSLAIVSVALLFLGACGLSRRIASPDRLSFAAIVTYGVACVAALIAAAINGFAIPSIMRHMAHDVPAAAQQWRIVIDGLFQMNQAFARIFSVAASAAIILWSVSAMRNGGLGRGIAIYGCSVGPLIIIGIAVGHFGSTCTAWPSLRWPKRSGLSSLDLSCAPVHPMRCLNSILLARTGVPGKTQWSSGRYAGYRRHFAMTWASTMARVAAQFGSLEVALEFA